MKSETLISIEDLKLHFKVSKGVVRAVDGVNMKLGYNEAVVILGESGCGKTSLAKAILRLLPRNIQTYTGKVILKGVDIMQYSEEEFRENVRWIEMSLVPQAAMNSLNPVLKVGDQVTEPLLVHSGVKKGEAIAQAKKMFQLIF